MNNIDVQAATKRGIVVANVLDAFTEEVSNHGLALLLSALRLEQQDDPQTWQHLIQRLDEIETHAQCPEIAPHFHAFREKLLASVQA